MPCRGASISAAAAAVAAGARPLGPLALALAVAAIFSAMPHGVLSAYEGLALPPIPNSPPPINLKCDGIPYPFGIGDKSASGFEVTCGPNRESMLPIGEHRFRIDQLSLPEGYVVILAGPIYQSCYGRNGPPASRDTGIGPINLTGTPFFFSKRNRLVATGCNYNLFANFTSSLSKQNGPPTFCATQCSGRFDAIFNGSCLGTACCKTDMPMDGAQEFTFTFNKTSANVTGEEAGTCGAAFFLDLNEEIFSNVGDSWQMPLKKALAPFDERRMVLDWVIATVACEQAQGNKSTPQYSCNSASSCINGRSGTGHICRCNTGFDQQNGNPYVANGCQDIDECRDWDVKTKKCAFMQLCNNTIGGYTCSCPHNMTGDGYMAGTSCTYILSPGSPIQNKPQGVGLALTLTLATTLLCYYWTMKKRKVAKKRADLFRKNGGLLLQQRFSTITSQGEQSSAKIFSAEQLRNATDSYSESRILGRGGSGTVYKGILPNNSVIAIKKSILFDESQVEQFVNEITILSQIDHPNVVKLLGCCLETKVPLLVYEFIPNGTLFQHIHNRSSLTWEDRLRLAEETAEALAYLHSTSSIPIIHRDIKSSNILLDENFVAKISDFGASRSVPFDQTHVTTLIQGTLGYLDPEYFQSSQLTEKSDVYSFGVVLAELLTRQKPISVGRPEEACNLAMHIVILFNERRLLQEIEPNILAEAGEEQIYTFAQLSVRCLNSKGEERPVMREVASVLRRLRESFAKEKTIRRNDESIQITDEQESVHSEARPISSLQSSKETTMQYSLPAEILSSSHLAR
uniref:Protein kinase domain-containing protein n=1 Tax=Leersia perrieri TaxID=77586 RepID=A0A0D9W8X8_9ORYZ